MMLRSLFDYYLNIALYLYVIGSRKLNSCSMISEFWFHIESMQYHVAKCHGLESMKLVVVEYSTYIQPLATAYSATCYPIVLNQKAIQTLKTIVIEVLFTLES